jgi:penicillin-binding protein 2
MAGRRGIEARLDNVLRGEAGGRLVRVDVSGYRHEELERRNAVPGSDVLLALDMKVQRIAEEALGGDPGAVVVVDPRNGDVLAMASTPGFNSNDFIPSISTAKWAAIRDDENTPLINRTVAGGYAPGSIFKPVVALAALENNQATKDTTFECDGVLHVGNTSFRCWTRGRHGVLNMQEALMRSCNVYFYGLGMRMGHEYITHMAAALGLGQKTGIDLPYELPGLVPDAAWVRANRDHGWRVGDTCNLSIGQGALTVTPLQMAMVTAAIANGGHLYRPRLIMGVRQPGQTGYRELPVKVSNELNWSPSSLQVVREGMRDVVMAERGTGKLAQVDGVTIAGKTGTAEYGRKEEGRKRGWMIAFAPYEAPRYAVVVLVEDALSGGTTAAPKVKFMLGRLLGTRNPMEGQG